MLGGHQNLTIAFRSKNKRRDLSKQGYTDTAEPVVSKRFDLKQQRRQYTMHHVAKTNTWLIDVVFLDNFAYYMFVNVNTRYLFVTCANATADVENDTLAVFAQPKEATGILFYVQALIEFEKSGLAADYPLVLIGDGEHAFATRDYRIQSQYKQMNATFQPVKRLLLNTRRRANTEPYHPSTSILDAAVKTLRDMLENVGLTHTANPAVMDEIVRQYNNSVHSTLTRNGPGFDISPNLVQHDRDLEMYLCRRITQQNIITKSADGFDVPIGSIVLVYSDISPLDKRRRATWNELFKVIEHERGVYTVRGMKTGVELFAPRWKIKPVQK
jgi:hypothetical protein